MSRPSPLLTAAALAIALSPLAACGLKGPPLPPLPATPEESDRIEARTSPRPSPKPSPKTSPKKSKPTPNPTETR